jgi:ubiquinone/menaquinone biosynthesis C-methylase UbiE
MGAARARFFAYVQGAGFYRQLLSDALKLLGPADRRTLLDVGCGPGALTRLAAETGFTATGIDSDPAMTSLAERLARRQHSPATFAAVRLEDARDRRSDVVVAASLLATSPHPARTLDQLRHLISPGGKLLIVETSDRMTVSSARPAIRDLEGPRRGVLLLWARARSGRTPHRDVLEQLPRQEHELLRGLATATILSFPPAHLPC